MIQLATAHGTLTEVVDLAPPGAGVSEGKMSSNDSFELRKMRLQMHRELELEKLALHKELEIRGELAIN